MLNFDDLLLTSNDMDPFQIMISDGVASSTASVVSSVSGTILPVFGVIGGVLALNTILFLFFGKDLLGGWK